MTGGDPQLVSSNPSMPTFFGDLTREVVVDAPVSHEELCRALAAVAGESPEDCVVASVPEATIHFVSTAAWHRRAASSDVRPACELAARAVHRRFARAIGAPALPPRTDPFIVPE